MASPLRGLACLALLALAAGGFCQEAGQGTPLVSRRTLGVPIPAGPEPRFRFLPGGPLLPFDRPLLLGAAPGEERHYSLEIEAGGELSRLDYLIDRREPPPPRARPETGLYAAGLEPSLEAEAGAAVYYALLGPEGAEAGFLPYEESPPPRLEPPAEGVRTWVLLAYAVDKAGNRSALARRVYRLAALGLGAEPPRDLPAPPEPRPDPLAEILQPEALQSPGRVELEFLKPRAGRLLAAVAPGGALGRPETFAPLPEREGRPRLELEAPYGWTGELPVYLALELEGRIRYRPEALRLGLSGLPPEPGPLAPPPPPVLVPGAPGQPAFLAFPSYEGEILLSLDGGPERPYAGPLALEPGQAKQRLAWRGSSEGRFSEASSLELERPRPLPEARILGAEGPALSGGPRRLSAPPGAAIRYELARGGALPPEPGPSSALLGAELLLDCPPGETRRYSLRVRPFTGPEPEALGGDSRLLSFEIDRSPPPRPEIRSAPASYSLDSLELELGAAEGQLFVSLSREGESAEFRPLEGPLSLPGSREGPLVYTLRAYARDEAGNSSPELGPLRFTVDSSSLYLDSRAPKGGRGSPESPFGELGEALEAARATGRRVLRLRGEFRLAAPLAISAQDLSLQGGFDAAWKAEPAARARILLNPPREGSPSLSLSEARLSLSGLELSAPPGRGSLVEQRGGSLELRNSSLSAESGAELLLLSLEGGELSLSDSSLRLGGRGVGSFLAARGARVEICGSELRAEAGLDYLGGLDLTESSLALADSRLSGRAALGLVLLSGRAADLELDRVSLEARGGPGYIRLGRFQASRGELRNCRLELEAAGSALLFDLEDSPLAFVHDSLFARVQGGRLRFFESRGEAPSFLNSLFFAPGGAELFLGTDRRPRAGNIASSAFAGFAAYLGGPVEARSLSALEALNAGLGLSPNRELPLEGSLREAPKDGLMPAPGSALLEAASPLAGENYARDFRGLPRPSPRGRGLPDIGADELQD